MKKIISIILILFLSILSIPSWSETLLCEELDYKISKKDGVIFKGTVPFTWKFNLQGDCILANNLEIVRKAGRGWIFKGELKNGIKVGLWETYDKQNALIDRGNYKEGKKEGNWEFYPSPYNPYIIKSNYKNGKLEGIRENFYVNGQLSSKENYKDGKLDGFWESYYYENGQLFWKGNWKDGKRDGLWEY